MTLTPINDDGDTGSMHNAVLKGKYKKLNCMLVYVIFWRIQSHMYGWLDWNI